MSLEVAMCTERLLDVTNSTIFSVQFDGCEVVDIIWSTQTGSVSKDNWDYSVE